MRRKRVFAYLLLGFIFITSGCVERELTIRSDPPGAHVYLDGVETGRTPVSVKFHWYGYRGIVLSKDGYEVEQQVVHVKPPIYQRFLLDFFFDLLVPVTIHDRHEYSFTLRPKIEPEPEKVLERAKELSREVTPQVPAEKK